MPCKICKSLTDILPCSPHYSNNYKISYVEDAHAYVEDAHSEYNIALYKMLLKNCVCNNCLIKLICNQLCDEYKTSPSTIEIYYS
jgi:radical SAM protein with 4Fe4S-binding SPASM domain